MSFNFASATAVLMYGIEMYDWEGQNIYQALGKDEKREFDEIICEDLLDIEYHPYQAGKEWHAYRSRVDEAMKEFDITLQQFGTLEYPKYVIGLASTMRMSFIGDLIQVEAIKLFVPGYADERIEKVCKHFKHPWTDPVWRLAACVEETDDDET